MTDAIAGRDEDTAGRYMFEQGWDEERRRLEALETIWDPYTFSNLATVPDLEGKRCLEVGAGGGSVVEWLQERVGPSGHVVATDLDTRFLAPLASGNLEVRRHDIVNDELEADAYDLIHTRLLLSHLPGHLQALRRMVDALKPGGWLIAEEFDHVTFQPDPGSDAADLQVWDAWTEAFRRLSEHRGLDLPYGRRLMGLFQQQGLEDVHVEGKVVMEHGGVAERALLLLSVRSLRETLIGTGAIDEAGVDRMIELLEDPDFRWMSQVMVAARGRKAG